MGMKEENTKPEPLWIDVSQIDMPRANWIWWVVEGTLESPGKGSRSFNSLHALQENVEGRGYKAPTSAEINEAVIQARVDGKDDAILQVLPTKSMNQHV